MFLLVLAWLALIITLALGALLFMADMSSETGRGGGMWWTFWCGIAIAALFFAAHHFRW
jgi:hypothetical protein